MADDTQVAQASPELKPWEKYAAQQAAAKQTSAAPSGAPDKYETSLTPQEEKQFQTWKQKYAPKDSGQDYDLRGAYKAGLKPDPTTGHWPDTYKKPNHPTFSNESKYAKFAPNKAGHWNGQTYVPPTPSVKPWEKYAKAQAQAPPKSKEETESDSWGGTDASSRLGRELVLGAFGGMGIAETQNPLTDTAKGIADLYRKPPEGVIEKGIRNIDPAIGAAALPAYRMAKGAVQGAYQAGSDIVGGTMQGIEGRPEGWERASHGVGQVLGTLATLGLGGTDELASPKTIETLRAHAGELDSRALKVAKGTSTATGLQVAQEGIWGATKKLPGLIEDARKAKETQIMQLAAKEDKASGPVHDVEKDIAPIEQEWKKVANARANLSEDVIKKVDGFLRLLRTQYDPQSGKFVPRDLSKLTMTDMVNLTRNDGLLARLSKFDKDRPVPEQVMNVARRVSQAFHDKIASVSPEIAEQRAAQSRLIEARDRATQNVEDILNDKTAAAKSIFKMGGGSIGAYVGLKLLGVPYAEAFATPLLLWNSFRSTPIRTLKAAVYARAADMLEGTVKGTYQPPTVRAKRPPSGGAPPTASATFTTNPPAGPTAAPGAAAPPGAPMASSAPLGPVSGVPATVTGGVAAGPPNIPNSLRLGASTAAPSAETAAALDKTWAAKAITDKALGATSTSSVVTPDAWTEADDAKVRQVKEIPKEALKKLPAPTKEATPIKTAEGAVPARLRQTLMDDIDRQVGRLDSSNAGVAKRAQNTLDQIKTLLDEKKVAGLTEEERKQLVKRANWREWQRKVRENKPAESVEAREAKPDAIAGAKSLTAEPASTVGTAEEFAIAKQRAYEALARFEGGKEWGDTLKAEAKKLQEGAAKQGVAYDPNSEFDAVLEAIKLMREQGMDMAPEKAPARRPIDESENESPISESRINPRKGDYPTQGIGPAVSAEKMAGGNIKMGADTERLARILGSSLYKNRGPGVVVKELLQNAYDATRSLPKGEGKVGVVFDDKEGSLIVHDNGPGMTPNEVYTVFTDLGSSGKGGQSEASGGFGLAKAAPFMIADKLEVETIARDPKGGFVKTSFTSTPDDIISGRVKPQIEYIPHRTSLGLPDEATGTHIKAFFDKKTQSMYPAREFARNARRSTRAPAELSVSQKYQWSSKPEKVTDDLAPVDTHVASVNIPDSAQLEVFKSSQKEPLTKALGSLSVEVQNNGLYQFTKTQWLGEGAQLRGVPSRIVVDVKALVNEGHENYPFSANREELRDLVDTKVNDIIKDHFITPALNSLRAEIEKIYHTLPTIKFSPGPGADAATAPILDAGNRLTSEEVEELQNNPAIKLITKTIYNTTYNTIKKMWATPFGGWLGDPAKNLGSNVERVGIVLSDKVHGVHVLNPKDAPEGSPSTRQGTVFINPFSFDKLASGSDTVASLIYHTIKHEIIHDVLPGHNATFTSAEAKMSHFLGMNHEIGELIKLRDAYEQARSGKNAEHFDRALQIYERSRARDEVTPDILGGEELSSGKPGSGAGGAQGVPASGEGNVGGGNAPQGGAEGSVTPKEVP
jgi:anti-sigma regulatory factor (Ser/Thr protein kinase)